jgi:hypothetical protein
MKFLIKFFIILSIFFAYNITIYADFIICDSWFINLDWKSTSEICNWWYQNTSILTIESFTWTFIDFLPGYIWNKNIWYNGINVGINMPVWFFDENRVTNIKNITPIYNLSSWYLWQSNTNLKNIDLLNNFPVWFFDDIRFTHVHNINPTYLLPVWNIVKISNVWLAPKNEIIVSTGTVSSIKNIENTNTGVLLPVLVIVKPSVSNWNQSTKISVMSIKEFYVSVFKKYTNSYYIKSWYIKKDYDLFINNMVDFLLLNWKINSSDNISEFDQNRIELDIENSKFNEKILLLIINMRQVNLVFEKWNNNNQIYYVLDYIINK